MPGHPGRLALALGALALARSAAAALPVRSGGRNATRHLSADSPLGMTGFEGMGEEYEHFSAAYVSLPQRGKKPASLPPPAHRYANMFEDTEGTAAEAKKIRALHASYPAGKPKAAVFILAYPIHCGPSCEAPMSAPGCTQIVAIKRTLETLAKNFFSKYEYPVVIFHPDWTAADRAAAEAKSTVPIFWQRIKMDEGTLPEYYERDSVLQYFRSKHPQGNVELPNKKMHGYGYRMMCRFFGGLIFHAPLMREFDYYMRLDGGDSRLDHVGNDPFLEMQEKSYGYGFVKYASTKPVAGLMDSYRHFLHSTAGVVPSQELLKPFVGPGGNYNGKYYYNNFEVVRMSHFRTAIHWRFFMAVDQSGAFMCPGGVRHGGKCQHGNNGIGDADFRSLAVAVLFKPNQVKQWKPDGGVIKYRHPVPDWCKST